MCPPTTTGCGPREDAPGRPNPHFSLRRGILSAVNPAASAGSKREFVIVTPQPFQAAPVGASRDVLLSLAPLKTADLVIGFVSSVLNDFPDRCSASAPR